MARKKLRYFSSLKEDKKRNMRTKPRTPMTSNKPGPKKHPSAPKNPNGFVKKAVYAKVPQENQGTLPRKSYTQLYELKRPPRHPELIKELAHELIAWSRQEDSIIIEEFSIEKGYSPVYFRKLIEKNDYFAQAYALAKAAVAARRERIVGKDLFKAMHPLYHDEWREYIAERDSRKDNNPGSVVVEMHPYPSSDKVPERE